VDARVVGEPAARVCSRSAKQQSLAADEQLAASLGSNDYKEPQCIALDGDKLKPREDQRKGGNGFGINEEGAGYTLTGVDRHGVAYETECYENHAQDSRVKPIEVSDTRNQKDGEGERWDNGEVAQTRNVFDIGYKRSQEVVVSMAQNTRDEVRIVGSDGQIAGALPAEPGMKQQTYVVSINSNGEDVAPTISSCEYKRGQKQKDTGGGVHPHPPRGFCLDRFGQYGDKEIASAMKMRDYKDHTDLVVYEKEGAEGE
jgi:hypothetical protein